jgi:hypothetical protein
MPNSPFAWVLLFAATAGAAQERPETMLRATASLPEPFSRIRDVRELSDGRLLVADQRENAVYVVDFAKQSRVQVGRNGPGPEEYDQPTGLLPVRADSTVLINLSNSRLDWLDSSGRITRSRALFGGGWSIPRAADTTGNLYWDRVSDTRLKKREDPKADQAPIVRANLAGKLDTMAFLTIPGPVNPNPFPSWDIWAVSADGSIAIVRNGEEYRVDWVASDKTITRGPAVPWKPVRVTADDRERYTAGGPNIPPGGGSARASSRAGTPPPPPRVRDDFPEQFPPARLSGIWVAANGRAFVHRYESLRELRPLLDVFDASGNLVARYRLPERRQIVGFGRSGLYAIHIDEVDLQWLERYPLPASR